MQSTNPREETLIRNLGATRLFHGYAPLICCIHLVVEDENRLLSLEHKLYPLASQLTGYPIHLLKRNMLTLIEYCWRHSNHAFWEKLAGCPLSKQPTLREFLDFTACYIRNHPR